MLDSTAATIPTAKSNKDNRSTEVPSDTVAAGSNFSSSKAAVVDSSSSKEVGGSSFPAALGSLELAGVVTGREFLVNLSWGSDGSRRSLIFSFLQRPCILPDYHRSFIHTPRY